MNATYIDHRDPKYMNRKKIAFFIAATMVPGLSAHASLSGNDLNAFTHYLSEHKDLVTYDPQKVQELEVLNNLTEVNNQLSNYTYWDKAASRLVKPGPVTPYQEPAQVSVPMVMINPQQPPVEHTPEIATEDLEDVIKLPPVDLSKMVTLPTPTTQTPEIATEDLEDVIKLPPVDLSKMVTLPTPTTQTPEIATEDLEDVIKLPSVDLSKIVTVQTTPPMTTIDPSKPASLPMTMIKPSMSGKTATTAVDEAAIAENKTNITRNSRAVVTVATQVENNTRAVAKESSVLNKHTEQIHQLASGVVHAETTGENALSRAESAFANAAAAKQALAATNQRVAADDAKIANHETRIQTLESQTSGNFAKLKSQVDDNRKRASAGISGVAAMANIPQVTNTQNFSVGAGVGTADSESALAVGFSARATENTIVKASVSDDSQHNFVAGAGVSYGW